MFVYKLLCKILHLKCEEQKILLISTKHGENKHTSKIPLSRSVILVNKNKKENMTGLYYDYYNN